MKKLLLALALTLAPSVGWGQCTGVFPSGTVCGNSSGASATPGPRPVTDFFPFLFPPEAANTVFAGPSAGAAAQPDFRALVGADLPNPSASTLGGVQSKAVVSNQFLTGISTLGVVSAAQPNFTDLAGNISVNQMNSGTGATSSTFWRGDGTWATFTGVSGPGSSTDRTIPTWNGTAGNLLRNNPTIGVSSVGALQMNPDGSFLNVVYFPTGFASSSLFIGNGGQSLSHTTALEGYYNTCVGLRCLTNITTGSYNTGGGFETMENCTTCNYNTGFGEAALIYNITGNGNTGVGWKAGLGTVGVGLGNYNTFLGYASGVQVAAAVTQNSAFGANALTGALTGNANTAGGYNSGFALTSGANNSFYGVNAGSNVTTGSNNSIFGACSGSAALSTTVQICDGLGTIWFQGSSAATTITAGTNGVTISGTTGNGFVNFPTQSSGTVPTPGTGFNLYANGSAQFAWKDTSGLQRSFGGTITSSRIYTFPDASITVAGLDLESQTVSGGANVTSKNLGTVSSGTTTINCGERQSQYLTNNGAFTLAAPANDGFCAVEITNGASAGAVTFSGFSVNPSWTGAPLTTTNGHRFTITIARTNGHSVYTVIPQQ